MDACLVGLPYIQPAVIKPIVMSDGTNNDFNKQNIKLFMIDNLKHIILIYQFYKSTKFGYALYINNGYQD